MKLIRQFKNGSQPIFYKHRTITFALKERVKRNWIDYNLWVLFPGPDLDSEFDARARGLHFEEGPILDAFTMYHNLKLESELNKALKVHLQMYSIKKTALKIFLILRISNCTGEKSFSLLKRLKSLLRTVISPSKLSSLALLAQESDITQRLDFNAVIDDFVKKIVGKILSFNILC